MRLSADADRSITMPHYYFDMADGSAFHDESGLDFADDTAARDAAVRALIEYAMDADPVGEGTRTFTVLVSDEHRSAIFSATLSVDGRILGP